MISLYYRIKRLFSLYVAYHADQDQAGLGARLRLMPRFAIAGVKALPYAARWARYRDPAARARVKQILDMSGPAPIALNANLLGPSQRDAPATTGVTIIMPVYNNPTMTMEALRRVAENTDIPWRLILIDDASPDPAVRPSLQAFAKTHGDAVHLILQDTNKGFVGTVNEGLSRARAREDPVVILNTDAFVPARWATRLLGPIWSDQTVATVTPLSNDAELGCVPAISQPTEISKNLADRLDEHARQIGGGPDWITAPAGVGFCMAIAPQFLQEVPQFDPVFAPGYGEEVDWCQKASRKGGRHVYLPSLFVAHMGGQSFGSEAKQRLIARNSDILSRRYPRFDAEVFGFVRRDPLVTARLSLGLAWAVDAGQGAALPIYIGHSMGGGAEIDLRRRIQSDLETHQAVVVVRFGGTFRFTLELWWPGLEGPVAAGTDDWSDITAVLTPVKNRHVIYSNAVGDVDPIEVPGFVLDLLDGADARLDVLIHDFFVVSPSVTLLGQGDVYRWPLDAADGRHQSRRANGGVVTLAEWQDQWRPVLTRADSIVCFSPDSLRIVQGAYGGLTSVVCEPHALPVAVPQISNGGGRPTIGILGNMSPQKGAQFVAELSKAVQTDDTPDLVLLGNMDPQFELAKGTRQHGPYTVADLPDLVAQYAITCWLIPSIWPETFSFTTHEAIATGLPVMVFDLGAQADAVRQSVAQGGSGLVLDHRHEMTKGIEACIRAAQDFGATGRT